MSGMAFLEKLLNGCELSWTSLGNCDFVEIANRGRRPVKASNRKPGNTPYYGANNIQDYVEGHTHEGEYVLIAEDGSASLENYSIQHVSGRFWANNHVHVIRGVGALSTRFLFHYLQIVNFVPFLSGGGRAKLTKGKMIEIPVPIPCPDNPEKSLAIQAEIVRILDNFTELTADLTAELTTELTARIKQYNYYRDQLLTFEEDQVEWKELGEIAELRRGRVMSKGYLEENAGKYPVYSSQTANNGQMGKITTYDFDGEFVNWTTDGAGAGTVFYRSGKFSITNVSGVIRVLDTSSLSTKYLFYWLSVEAKRHVYAGMGNPKLMSNQVAKIPVPIPRSSDRSKPIDQLNLLVAVSELLSNVGNGLVHARPPLVVRLLAWGSSGGDHGSKHIAFGGVQSR